MTGVLLFGFLSSRTSPAGASFKGHRSQRNTSRTWRGETLTVDLSKVSAKVEEIIFTATIHKAEERKQNFGQVRNAYIRIYNMVTDEEIARYDLDEDFSVETAVEFGRLYRRNREWKFEALGVGYKGGLQYFVNKYAG